MPGPFLSNLIFASSTKATIINLVVDGTGEPSAFIYRSVREDSSANPSLFIFPSLISTIIFTFLWISRSNSSLKSGSSIIKTSHFRSWGSRNDEVGERLHLYNCLWKLRNHRIKKAFISGRAIRNYLQSI